MAKYKVVDGVGIIPKGVKKIANDAFSDCTSLTSVEIPSSVTAIGECAFYKCTSLTSVEIPSSVIAIGENAFSDCTSLTSVKIPSSVTKIGHYAFDGCTSLTSVVIPEGVRKIGDYAFSGCTSLTSVEIPSSVTKIGKNAFSRCTSLTSIVVAEGNRVYDSREGCNAIIETKTNTLIRGLASTIIPSSVTAIGENAFSDCSSSVKIPSSVTKIGDNAFSGCTSLTSVEIPSSVTEIGRYVFYGCTSLTSIEIPSSITEIGWFAFSGCTSLTSVEIPSSVTEIGRYAFEGCTSLISIEIPSSVKQIGSYVFYGCSSLKSVVIPSSVTAIGEAAFKDCTSLTSIVIPEGVTKIENDAFKGCTSLIYVVLPDGLTRIGEAAFMDCTSLTSVVIPEGVRKIGDEAFSDCTSLTNVVISSMRTKIGRNVFEGCTSLTIAKRANQSAPAINDKLNSSDNSCNEDNSCNDKNTKKVELMIKPRFAYRLYIFPIVGEEANALVDEYMYSEEFDADLVTELDYIIAEETDRTYEICVDFYSSKDGAEYSIDNINFKELEDNALWIDSALGSYGIAHYGDDCSEDDFDEDFCLIGRIKMAHDYEYPMTKEIFKDIMDQHNRGYEDMDGNIIVDAIKRRMKQIAEQLVNDGLADDIDSVRFALQYGEIYGEPFYVNIKTDEFDPNKLRALKCDWNDCDNMPDILTEHYDSETLLQYIVYDEKFYELECGGINDFRFTVDLVNSDLESLRF